MSHFTEFVTRYGYAILFGWVLAEQLGFPVPAIPLLLAAGALAGAGKLSFALTMAAALAACLLGDLVWFELGKRRGAKVLNFLCRVSLEPDTCVRKTENSFATNGPKVLLFAKFVPGLSTMAPPLAGMFHFSVPRFLLYDAAGSVLWAGAFAGLGWLFSDQLERVAEWSERLGSGLLVIMAAALGGYILWKYIRRQLLIRELRVSRIAPEELKAMMDAGNEVVIVDLRHAGDVEADPQTIPGAFVVTPEDLEEQHANIPRDREIILYCT